MFNIKWIIKCKNNKSPLYRVFVKVHLDYLENLEMFYKYWLLSKWNTMQQLNISTEKYIQLSSIYVKQNKAMLYVIWHIYM